MMAPEFFGEFCAGQLGAQPGRPDPSVIGTSVKARPRHCLGATSVKLSERTPMLPFTTSMLRLI
jgi:hypothetical protein